MAASLRDLAREMNASLDPSDPPSKRALQVARELARSRPDASSRGRQRAAAAAAGAPKPMSDAEMDREIVAGAAKTTVSDPDRKTSRPPVKRVKIPSPVKSAGTVKGLVLQAVSLTALYWVLRTPDAVTRATSGAASVFGWLASTRGIPGAKTPR